MKSTKIFFASLFLSINVLAKDYKAYHLGIIEAEKEVFVNKNYKVGLQKYISILSDYDFVFLTDCITALQISVFNMDKQSFNQLLSISFKNGLIPRSLKKISYITNSELYKNNNINIDSLFDVNVKKYYKRINVDVLKSVYDLYAFDQLNKNPKKNEALSAYNRRYNAEIKITYNKLANIILTYGFPSDKLIGIEQKDIMNKLGSKYIDMIDYYYDFKKLEGYNIKADQFKIEELAFSSTLFHTIFHHYGKVYSYPNYFDDSIYMKEILNGNVHPKDLAAILDIPYNSMIYIPDSNNNNRYFATGIRIGPGFERSLLPLSDNKINSFRKKFFIAPIENDRKKWNFMISNGMYIGWGYEGTRS